MILAHRPHPRRRPHHSSANRRFHPHSRRLTIRANAAAQHSGPVRRTGVPTFVRDRRSLRELPTGDASCRAKVTSMNRLVTAALACAALLCVPATASADVLVDEGPTSISCGQDIRMGVWFRSADPESERGQRPGVQQRGRDFCDPAPARSPPVMTRLASTEKSPPRATAAADDPPMLRRGSAQCPRRAYAVCAGGRVLPVAIR